MPVCRLLPLAVADGPHSMAADEVLLRAAMAGVASLRFYGWSEATVSLGYFQPEQARLENSTLADLPFVRRPSGGAALVHHHELTYALALPPGPPWQRGSTPAAAWLKRLHGLIAAALASFGVSTNCASYDMPSAGALCFQRVTGGDLMIGDHKIVGSAQRRQRGALLQHGGILLAASSHAPDLPGIRELCGRSLEDTELCDALQREFTRDTDWQLQPADWTGEEHDRLVELVQNKYSQPAWNQKR
jgi:lipoate-protein ligase A